MNAKDKLISDLTKALEEQIDQNEILCALLLKAEHRILDLEKRLNMKSTNSGKPPSSDGLNKAAFSMSIKNSKKIRAH